MELIAFQMLAFLDNNVPILERLEQALRGSYRLQLWFRDRSVRLKARAVTAADFPVLSTPSYDGFVQVPFAHPRTPTLSSVCAPLLSTGTSSAFCRSIYGKPARRYVSLTTQSCEDHFRAVRAIAASDSGFSVKEFLERSHRARASVLVGSFLNSTHHKRSKIYDSRKTRITT